MNYKSLVKEFDKLLDINVLDIIYRIPITTVLQPWENPCKDDNGQYKLEALLS